MDILVHISATEKQWHFFLLGFPDTRMYYDVQLFILSFKPEIKMLTLV